MLRLVLLVILTMIAFAANSVLNRAALIGDGNGPAAFASLRIFSGALCLALLVVARKGGLRIRTPNRWVGTGALALYMLGFSFAYVALDAGVGALILFGGVQITMFAGAVLAGDRPAFARWLGSVVAFLGLAWLLWPSGEFALPVLPSVLMAAAALGWGVYSLVGRSAKDPLAETAANFICAAPIALVVWLWAQDSLTGSGIALAAASGAITSALGYALWYSLLPKLDTTVAALAQLTVPVIAIVGGSLFLAELPTLKLVLASALVLGGVAFGVIAGQRTNGSKGS